MKEKLGIVYGVSSALVYALMMTGVKLANSVENSTLIFFRAALCLLLIMPVLWKQKISIRTQKPFLHLLRMGSGLLTLYASFYAIKNLFLVDAVLLYNTIPLFIPWILFFWSRETISQKRLFIAAFGFIGVLFILKPSFSCLNIPGLIGLCSGIFGAFSFVVVKKLSGTDPPERIVFYFFLGTVIGSFFPMVALWKPISSLFLWGLILLISVLAFLYQLFITKAYSFVSPTKISFVSYLAVMFSAMSDFLVWKKVPDFWTLLGMVFIVGGGVLLLAEKREKELSS